MSSQPAYIPERQLGLSSDMTLLQRVANTAMNRVYNVLFYLQAWRCSQLQRKYGIAPAASLVELVKRAELWVFAMNFVLDYPRPLPPNVVVIANPSIGVHADLKVGCGNKGNISEAFAIRLPAATMLNTRKINPQSKFLSFNA